MPSVTEFLMERIASSGIKHIFGVPGGNACHLFKAVRQSKGLSLVNTTDGVGAAFAADAYARTSGLGCVVTACHAGALRIVGVVAGAYAERSPMLVISGSPGASAGGDRPPPQRQFFQSVTCDSAVLSDPTTAGLEIDRALESLRHHKRPVYLELPEDAAGRPISYDVYKQGTPVAPKSDRHNLLEAVEEVAEWLGRAESPVILVGVEIARFGFGRDLLKFAERSNIAVATTPLGKSAIDEQHPLHLGVYTGKHSHLGVREAVENSDCLISLGVLGGDITLECLSERARKRNVVSCAVGQLMVKNHEYHEVHFQDFVGAILTLQVGKKGVAATNDVRSSVPAFAPAPHTPITKERFFLAVDSLLDSKTCVVSDVGTCLKGSMGLRSHSRNSFLGSAVYHNMGMAIPGAVGVGLASPGSRQVVLVGDGAFQSSAMELGTALRHGLRPTVFVLNNGGYACDHLSSIHPMQYHKIVDLLGGGEGYLASTEEELFSAIQASRKGTHLSVINVVVGEG